MGKFCRKRKRKFFGNRFTKSAADGCEETIQITASSSKLKSSAKFENIEEELCGNRIFDLNILLDIFSELCCPKCFAVGLYLMEDSRYGLCSHFCLKCKNCNFSKGFATSKKTVNLSETNSRFVYGMRQIGKGFLAAYKLCATLNLPALSKTAYASHEEKLFTAIKSVAEKSMSKAATEIKGDSSQNVECGVSVDGTWQRRGYTSLNGCVAAISIDTGKVLDIEVMSLFCPTCKKLSKMPKDLDYESKTADHIGQCYKNFEGSSTKMECVGAERIFSRSIAKHNIKYSQYYGDGDSKGFLCVKDIYGQDSVKKLECVGHVQKRVGSRLRSLRTRTKGLSGKGKLTDKFIDRIQNYYGIAIRSNVGQLKEMQQAAIAVLFHCASSSNKPMHGQCPSGNNSWCSYQRAVAHGLPPESKYPGLPNNILNVVKPTYLELCSTELLQKCLHGKTQNANECFNGSIWQRVPKEVFVCLKILKLGAYDAVVQFNDGYLGCLDILYNLNVCESGFFTSQGYKQLDRMRIKDSKRHSTTNAKCRRKILRAIRKNKTPDLNKNKDNNYKSGAF